VLLPVDKALFPEVNSLLSKIMSLLTKNILFHPLFVFMYMASSVELKIIEPFKGLGIAFICIVVILGGTKVFEVLSNSSIELLLGVVVPIPTCEKLFIEKNINKIISIFFIILI
jgi:hypothetical protein